MIEEKKIYARKWFDEDATSERRDLEALYLYFKKRLAGEHIKFIDELKRVAHLKQISPEYLALVTKELNDAFNGRGMYKKKDSWGRDSKYDDWCNPKNLDDWCNKYVSNLAWKRFLTSLRVAKADRLRVGETKVLRVARTTEYESDKLVEAFQKIDGHEDVTRAEAIDLAVRLARLILEQKGLNEIIEMDDIDTITASDKKERFYQYLGEDLIVRVKSRLVSLKNIR